MTLSWTQIARLGLVQMALGAVVVLTTSTLNRLMVVEFALPALLPGLLVGLHYGIQLSRPRWGFTSDTGGNRTRWIIGGMVALALGGMGAAFAVTLFAVSFGAALTLSVLSYSLIGIGVGASGTSLLALLATATAPERRAAAATITWLMMIFGIAMTAGLAGHFLDPYSPQRLLGVVAVITSAATLLTILAIGRIESRVTFTVASDPTPFIVGLREIWAERKTRNFTLFVFLSMNAYFMQELILEPYAGLVFELQPRRIHNSQRCAERGCLPGDVDRRYRCNRAQDRQLAGMGNGRLFRVLRHAGANWHDRRGTRPVQPYGTCRGLGLFQWDVRGGCDWFDDGAGLRGARQTRRDTDGPVGCRPSDCCGLWRAIGRCTCRSRARLHA